jgi:hypothetical protein
MSVSGLDFGMGLMLGYRVGKHRPEECDSKTTSNSRQSIRPQFVDGISRLPCRRRSRRNANLADLKLVAHNHRYLYVSMRSFRFLQPTYWQ